MWVVFYQAGGLQNEHSLLFQVLQVSKLSNPSFCQNKCLSSFLPSERLTKWAKFAFSSFWNFKTFKICHFCEKRRLGIFYQAGGLQNEQSLLFSRFLSFKGNQNFQNPYFCLKDVLVYFFTKRAAYKMSKFCLFKTNASKNSF